MTGNKSELIQRLMYLQQHSTNTDSSDGIIAATENNDGNSITSTWNKDNTNLDPSISQLPDPLIEALIKYSSSSSSTKNESSSDIPTLATPKLLPIQEKSYEIISKGNDAVLFSPTGTGKSLAVILPLAARLYNWKHDGSLEYKKQAQKQRFIQLQASKDRNDSFASTRDVVDPAEPSILIVEPARELARQVGKVWGKFHPTATKSSRRHVVTVYGGT